MNVSFFSLTRENTDYRGNRPIIQRGGRARFRKRFRCLTALSLALSSIFSPLRADEYLNDSTDSPRQELEFKIKPSAEGMVLTWFGEVGVPFQVQSSTD